MAIPANKSELIKAVKTNYEKLRLDLIDIPANFTKQKEMEGHSKGTFMSTADLVACLIGWGQLVLTWNKKKDKGELVYFPDKGYKWNELGKLAQKFYADYEKENYVDLLYILDRTFVEILTLIDNKTNAQLYGVNWYEKWTLGRMIQLNTSSPYSNARSRLRKWKKGKGL